MTLFLVENEEKLIILQLNFYENVDFFLFLSDPTSMFFLELKGGKYFYTQNIKDFKFFLIGKHFSNNFVILLKAQQLYSILYNK